MGEVAQVVGAVMSVAGFAKQQDARDEQRKAAEDAANARRKELAAQKARADVENTDDLLRPDMYASASLTTGTADAVVVPQSAIVRVRENRYAIIKVGPETFRRVPVKGYDLNSKSFAITEGVEQGWQVLAEGAVLLNDRFAKQED